MFTFIVRPDVSKKLQILLKKQVLLKLNTNNNMLLFTCLIYAIRKTSA